MQYCGNCGSPLTPQEVLSGKCPVCHAPVHPRPETIPAPPYDETPDWPRTNSFPGEAIAPPHYPARDGMHISVLGQVDIGGKIELQQPKKSSTGAIAVLLALVGLLLVLSAIAVAFFVINPHSGHIVPLSETATSIAYATGTSAIPATAIVGFASGTPSAGQPTHTPGTGTPHSSKTPTPTTSPNAPVLVVTPQSFTLSVCAENKVTFSVVNSGGSALKWTASSGYTLDHSQGVVAPGSSDSVTASKILQSGTVTISATDIDGNPLSSSPQSVTVTCKL